MGSTIVPVIAHRNNLVLQFDLNKIDQSKKLQNNNNNKINKKNFICTMRPNKFDTKGIKNYFVNF